MRRIGILGGTFDPPHLGHLIIAEEVMLALQLDQVWFMPTNEPPHKQNAMTVAADRVKMLEYALEDNERFRINTIELEREGKSYTFDTMSLLKEKYPNDTFYFIIGADMVEYLPKWQRIDDLLNIVTFVGVNRPGYELKTKYPIMEVDIPLIDISSSYIRSRLQNNKSVNYLVPDAVYEYIKGNHLYEVR